MANYRFIDFMKNRELTCDNNFSMSVYKDYLRFFENKEFEFDGTVKCIVVKINEDKTRGATAKVYLYEHPTDYLLGYPEGKMPGPIGELELLLDADRGPDVKVIRTMRP